MNLLDHMHRTAFLGAEFLTWLWWRSEKEEVYELDPEFGPFEVWFEDKLVVGSATINAQENYFKGGHPASSLEARTALKLGKLAHEAKMRIVRGAQEWSFAFKAEGIQAVGIKLPAVMAREDAEKFEERMYLLEQLDLMLKGLFRVFLARRLSPDWEAEELPAIQRWVCGEGSDEAPPSLKGIRFVQGARPARRPAEETLDEPKAPKPSKEANSAKPIKRKAREEAVYAGDDEAMPVDDDDDDDEALDDEATPIDEEEAAEERPPWDE